MEREIQSWVELVTRNSSFREKLQTKKDMVGFLDYLGSVSQENRVERFRVENEKGKMQTLAEIYEAPRKGHPIAASLQ